MVTELVNKILAAGIILSQIFILAVIVYAIFFRPSLRQGSGGQSKTKNAITEFIGKHGLVLAFITALISMFGSLFYSQIAGFEPCDLCWFQRIFMYPLVFLLGLALIKKDSRIADYALTLSVVGAAISLYHNYMYYYNQGLNVFCQLGGAQVSCVKRYVFEFGYVTIPMMALTAFILIIIFLLFKKYYSAGK